MIKNYTTTEYSIEELNLYVNEIARTNLSNCKKTSMLRQIYRKYKDAYGVYKITNIKNGKIYIGSTLDDEGFLRRFKRHQSTLLKREHFNIHLQRSFNKYGEDAFVYEVIEFYYLDDNLDKAENKKALEKREQYYMDLYQVRDETKGYNEADHAHGGFNWLTWETLEKRSKITKE